LNAYSDTNFNEGVMKEKAAKCGSRQGEGWGWMIVIALLVASGSVVYGQEQKTTPPVQVSDAERKAIEKINTAATPDAKMKAANDFLKKYAKSPLRDRVATYLAEEVVRVSNRQQRTSLLQNYLSLFNLPEEGDLVRPQWIEDLFEAGKFDQALNEASQYLSRNPEDVTVHISIAWAGANQVQKQAATPKLAEAANLSSAKAVEMMEADLRPARFSPEGWASYRDSWLYRLYQARGLMLIQADDKAQAKENLEKSAGLEPYDPSTLLMLVNITNDEYQTLAQRYQAEKKEELLTEALARMDEVIEWLARAVAATNGREEMKQANQSFRETLEAYYNFRHEGKMEGMQPLIDKFKRP
jgi:tetratricopeptide (TPR) repeat protein